MDKADVFINEMSQPASTISQDSATVGKIHMWPTFNYGAWPYYYSAPYAVRYIYPNADVLALMFHEAYERLAPKFGYVTREETRTFDKTSPNGQLMIAVCRELLDALEMCQR